MRNTELTAKQWANLAPLLPPRRPRGRPRAEDRKTPNGISYVLRTGCRWQDVPREYGSPTACWRRLKAWEDGTWEKVWRGLLALLDERENLDWDKALLDGSFIPAKRGCAVGKTKRGKGTKLMLAADGSGLPIDFEAAGANHHEEKLAVGTLETVRVSRRGRGRPKQRPEELAADKAYDSRRFREWLHSKGIKPTIPYCERREEAP